LNCESAIVEAGLASRLLLNKKETAEALRISVQSVDCLILSKQLRPVHIGARVLLELRELERYVANQKRNPRNVRGGLL
jgi:hypothetical protein